MSLYKSMVFLTKLKIASSHKFFVFLENFKTTEINLKICDSIYNYHIYFSGFSIDIMAGFTVLFGSMLQIPLSTTHCKVRYKSNYKMNATLCDNELVISMGFHLIFA